MNKVIAVLAYLIILSFAGCTNENVNENLDLHAAHIEETCTDAYEYNAAYGIPENEAAHDYQQSPENAEDVVMAAQPPSPSPSPPPTPIPTPAPTPRPSPVPLPSPIFMFTATPTPLPIRVGENRYIAVGDIIPFGNHLWRVLDLQDSCALIITKNVICGREYHRMFAPVTWETSEIRRYLNSTFLDTFSESDRERIIKTTITTTKQKKAEQNEKDMII